ncbi:MAG: DUF1080 domain-containing protein [Chitinophagia bacterium]|nr:DUF1080 domain-containing protein [Chitinophagia bacterium]
MIQTAALALGLMLLTSATTDREPRLRRIFNGRDLTGWTVSQGADQWTVAGRELLVRNNAERKGSILWTQKSYRDFILQADFLMGDGTVDSGFFLRSEKDQIQIGISGSLKRDLTASPYIPGKGYPVEAKVADILRLKDWNTMKIRVRGNAYTVWLNGREVMNYTSATLPETGPIGIQLHPKNEMSIRFRDIRLAEL